MIDIEPSPVQAFDTSKLIQSCTARMATLETYRYSWWVHWREIADYVLPRRYRWLVTPNQWNRGSPINQKIIDETGSIAARILASGMMSGITSPSRPWFGLQMHNPVVENDDPAKLWCDEVSRRMLIVMSNSNYYTSKAVQYLDLATFGTAPMLIYEDDEDVINCYNPAAGEYYCAAGSKYSVDTLYRKFVFTCQDLVDEFGIENVSMSTRQAVETGGGQRDREVIVAHAIEPNTDYSPKGGMGRDGVPKYFKWREVYWEFESSETKALRTRGYIEQPFSVPRWDLIGNEPYGRSPVMDALPSIKQLQLMAKRLAQAIDKMVNPPMVASVDMKNQPVSLLPGGVTYVSNPEGSGFKPVFSPNIPVQELTANIQDVRQRVEKTLFNDLFMMISQLTSVETATQIDARREEKLVQLGPVLERFQNEGLQPDIDRIFAIMYRRGLLPPAPPELAGMDLKVTYSSALIQMQRAAQTGGLERLWGTVGNLAGAVPDVLDLINFDEAVDLYSEMLGNSPKIMNTKADVQAIRAARAKQQETVAQAQQAAAMAKGAQVLSQTPVGGGQSALQTVMNGPPQQ